MPSDATITAAGDPFNRVPSVTADFWIIKLLAVTVGETAADYLILNAGLGLGTTSAIMSVILLGVLAVQFAQRRYVPWAYWLAVVMISVVGTLITDTMVDNLGISLPVSTIGFSIALAATFAIWYAVERTLSIHTIFTTRREIYYWLAILFTFALGTAAGDLVAERFELGYLVAALLFAAVIGAVAFGYYVLKLDGILSFWLAYIFTRPLGASMGALFAQPMEYGGLGFGTTMTSVLFLGCIVLTVVYLTLNGLRAGQASLGQAAQS